MTTEAELRDAIIAGNSNCDPNNPVVITLVNSIRLDATGAGEDFAATGDLDIRGNITIVGQASGPGDNTTMIYNNEFWGTDRVFHVHAPCGKLTIDSIYVQSAKSSGPSLPGDAIYNAGGSLTMINSTVTGSSNGPNQLGGGIYNTGDCVLENTLLIHNSDEGAFVNLGKLDATDTTFEANRTLRIGGAAIENQGGYVNCENCVFDGNTANQGGAGPSWGGGAIYTKGRNIVGEPFDVELHDCLLVDNIGNDGGAMFVDDSDVFITGGAFEDNQTGQMGGANGGAIAAYPTGSNSFSCVFVCLTDFSGNVATRGGAINANSSATAPNTSTVDIANCLFEFNTAVELGGALAASGGNTSINNADVPGFPPTEIRLNDAGRYDGGGGIWTCPPAFVGIFQMSSNTPNNRTDDCDPPDNSGGGGSGGGGGGCSGCGGYP